MIRIICNSEAYTYNTYHMIKAFYPAAQAVCRVEEKASNYVTVLLENGRKITALSLIHIYAFILPMTAIWPANTASRKKGSTMAGAPL